ncbi:MAG TPA: hypothetical protein K8V88_08930, partial [Companilactobacillus farciminis]|nr:hypothetical protein [Companilactobacillus farciminis]
SLLSVINILLIVALIFKLLNLISIKQTFQDYNDTPFMDLFVLRKLYNSIEGNKKAEMSIHLSLKIIFIR